MTVLFPLMTFLLIMIGAFCLFMAMDNHRRTMLKATRVASHEGLAYSKQEKITAK
ncbi:hypothetical protein [Paenibacillus sp. NPDC058071]|uniref:hypothetical protein n=1 Tax=Paenibacillus sp. NPDC058071 TaxID=3346326 RepID=UPI0036DF9731